MNRSTFGIVLGIALAGSLALEIVLRDVWILGLGIAATGAAVGLLARRAGALPDRPSGAAGLAVGVAISLPIVLAIQYLSPIETIVNSEDTAELLGLWPILVGVWLVYVVASVAAFALARGGRSG